ncbi:Protein canopy 4 [Stylophora pistillata]|uniref:Protein canopy 4 n=2 Tax=Stylophora pistillata TaxID=50429 RepID=A0A2B4S7R6_STYPI|nr:Protein canopy 4 [Stylophora pistillata]
MVFVIVFLWTVIYAEDFENEYEIIDGIKIKKDSIVMINEQDGKKGEKNERSHSEEHDEVSEEDRDDDNDDDDVDDDEDDGDDGGEGDLETAKNLPTKCHVCRLLAVEVENKLSKNARIRKPREGKPPIYYKEELVILRVTENICDAMTKYNVRAKVPFRYKRGVKSMYRKQIEEVTKDSRIQKWVFATPEEEIDDPTGEIRRLKEQCYEMLKGSQKLLIHWFMKAQSRDLTKWLCAKRVLIDDDKECLQVEMPRRNQVAALRQKKVKIVENNTTSAAHEEL